MNTHKQQNDWPSEFKPDAALVNSLHRVVRRALRSGQATSSLSRQILEMKRAMTSKWPEAARVPQEELCRAIAQEIAAQFPANAALGGRDTLNLAAMTCVDGRY